MAWRISSSESASIKASASYESMRKICGIKHIARLSSVNGESEEYQSNGEGIEISMAA